MVGTDAVRKIKKMALIRIVTVRTGKMASLVLVVVVVNEGGGKNEKSCDDGISTLKLFQRLH
jgi:hypothetical protein